MDLFTSVYLKFFLGAFPERDGKLTYARRSEDLSAYIWGKPTLFFIWDFMLSWKFGDYFESFPYYAEGKLAFQGDKLWEDPLPFAREKIASLPLYNPSLIDEKQKEELLFFVDQAKKQQIKKYARNLEEAEQCNRNAWPIFCFSTKVGVPFREGEDLDVNHALEAICTQSAIKPDVTSANMGDLLFLKYLRLIDGDSYREAARAGLMW